MDSNSKREILKTKVVDLVRMFVNSEGGITQGDLECLFGHKNLQEIASALADLEIKFT